MYFILILLVAILFMAAETKWAFYKSGNSKPYIDVLKLNVWDRFKFNNELNLSHKFHFYEDYSMLYVFTLLSLLNIYPPVSDLWSLYISQIGFIAIYLSMKYHLYKVHGMFKNTEHELHDHWYNTGMKLSLCGVALMLVLTTIEVISASKPNLSLNSTLTFAMQIPALVFGKFWDRRFLNAKD